MGYTIFVVMFSLMFWGAEVKAHDSILQRRTGINPTIGLAIGERIPDFRATDQYGQLQDFSSIRGPKGAVIYFHRSAAWCIYCRMQLVQLEELQEAFQRNGIGVCAISYDSSEILQDFAKKKKLNFPLLSDTGSKIIRDFNILDTSVLPGSAAYGVPYHGSYVVNEVGVVVSKFFEPTFEHSSGIVLTRLFGSPLNTHEKFVKHDHLDLRYYASSNRVAAGDQLTLTIEVLLHDKVHVYAPGAKDYFSIVWELESTAAFSGAPVDYPSPQIIALPSIQEKVPIYQGSFRITRSITLHAEPREIHRIIDSQGNLVIKGILRFQACDNTMCYVPRKVSLEWKITAIL
jgi:peroxiredoxin